MCRGASSNAAGRWAVARFPCDLPCFISIGLSQLRKRNIFSTRSLSLSPLFLLFIALPLSPSIYFAVFSLPPFTDDAGGRMANWVNAMVQLEGRRAHQEVEREQEEKREEREKSRGMLSIFLTH